ncbi:xylulose kinase-like isoform X2 [Dysidea avara]
MWVKAFDLMFARLEERGFPFGRVVSVSGCGQQHGSVYWKEGAQKVLQSLDSSKSLYDQLIDRFSIANSPVWKDASTTRQCRMLEEAMNGPEVVAKITGSRAYERFTGNQIAKICQEHNSDFKQTERISLVSSFGPSLLLGDYASIDYSDGSGMNLLDIHTKDWNQTALDACAPGLRKLLGVPTPSCSMLGTISNYFVQRYHFSADCKVCAFTGDNPSALAGMRLQQGDIAVSLGTSDTLFLWLDEPKPQLVGHVLINPVDSSAYMALLCYKNGSMTREWIRDKYADKSWEKFEKMLASTQPGNGGNIGFYFTDTEIIPVGVKGCFKFDKDDKKVEDFSPEEEIRAVVEGQLMAKLSHAQHLGYHVNSNTRILVTGGASENIGILQVLADVFGAPVYTLGGTKNAACLGGAYIAKCVYTDPSSFAGALQTAPQYTLTAQPVASVHQVYKDMLPRLQKLESDLLSHINDSE